MVRDDNAFSGKMKKMEIGDSSDYDYLGKPDVQSITIGAMIGATIIVAAALYIFGPSFFSDPIVQFTCPQEVGLAENYDAENFATHYEQETKKITNNLTHFLETFRTEAFDDWGRPYKDIKAGMYHWKSTKYPAEIEEGDSIFESACGIGLNLYMTLEILREVKNIDTLYVYGNEYLRVSADKANFVFDNAAPNKAKKGTICTGDSTNLYFVPSNAFDLVYTGYISPILDPLHLNLNSTDENYEKYTELCRADDWESKKLVELAQEMQQNFYAKWVGEMVRIAKPGKAIIVEQISFPYCEDFLDWGGVNPDWWLPAMSKYGWDVDPISLSMEDDTIFRHRYHVFMRKNKQK